MKVKIEISVETESGEYELRFWNMDKPGEGIEYNEITTMLRRIFGDVDKQVGNAPPEDDQVYKEIH